MARSATRLSESENEFFHKNYSYMWQKLNTAPYYVSGSGECPPNIRGTEYLPSYVNLSKCNKPDYVPSTTILNKIVQFYNANIEPEVTAFQFIKEDLSLSDADRRPMASKFDERFMGTYFGYYYSESDSQNIIGVVIKIYEEHHTMRCTAISGIYSEETMFGLPLRHLMAKDYISLSEYSKFRSSLNIAHQRTTMYQGGVIMTDRFLILQLRGIDKESKNLAITLSIEGFKRNAQYLGGLSFSTLISDRFDIQFFMMAIARGDDKALKPISMNDERLKSILAINKLDNEHIILTPRDDMRWYEMIIENGNK